MKINDALLGALMLVIGAVIALHAQTFPVMAGMQYGPEFFPTLIGAGIALCGAGLVGGSLLTMRKTGPQPWMIRPDWMKDRVNIVRASSIVIAVVFYILAAPLLGFMLTVFLTGVGLLMVLGNPIWLSLVIAGVLPLILHMGFSIGLRVPMPRGVIEKLLF